jgi:stage V sporulation protein D (sporulation-specific penicillin-binding protein)
MDQPKKHQPDRRANRTILGRTIFLMGVFGVVMFIPLFWKLWQIQIVNHDFYEEYAIDQQTRDVAVSADRGTIYDTKGNILAMSGTVSNVILSPRDTVSLQESYEKKYKNGVAKEIPPEPTNEFIASGLADILGIEKESILKRLEKVNSAYEVLASKVEDEVASQVRQFILDNKLGNAIVLTPDSKRYYPNSSLAAHVLGFVDSENHGAYGLEAIYDEELSGEAGRVITAKNAKGTEMLSSYENYIDAVDGYDIHLTLDSTIQHYAERVLQEGISNYDVRNGGFCIVMNPKTGGIYGMASAPDYDLNSPRTIADEKKAAELEAMKSDPNVSEEAYLEALGNAQYAQWWNKCLNDTYEPGSTFKTIVLAAALEEGVVTENSTFYCSGKVKVAGWDIKCHKHEGHGSQTLRQAAMNSCNPAFIAIGQALGAEKFYQYMEDFGLLSKTGIDLPESSNANQFWDREKFISEYGISNLATASFGQRFNITPIQLITAASAAINGGYLVQPHLLQSVTDQEGNTVETVETNRVRQVVSEETSAKVRSILESVVGDGGTGKNAYVAGYRIGGKTGTSQTLVTGELIVSFLGFAPADDPEIIVLLAYDRPTPSFPGSNYTAGGTYISGGNMGALMAGELMGDILDYMGVPKQYTQEELSGVDTLVPKVTNVPVEEAQRLLKKSGLAWRTVGEGSAVTDQIPAQGASIPKGSQVVLYLGEEKPSDLVEVPNLEGKSPESAQAALNKLGLYMRASGALEYYTDKTVAASQSEAAGTQVQRGTVIEVRFVDNEVKDYAAN